MQKPVACVVGGGSCPGITPLLFHLYRMFGDRLQLFRGWDGFLEQTPVKVKFDHRSLGMGGSIIGTSRYKPTETDVARMAAQLVEFDHLIGVGGNDTLSVLERLGSAGYLHVLGIPKTLDSDINAGGPTLGHMTVLDNLVQAALRTLDSIRDHDRFVVFETIGQDAGWLALRAGRILGADAIVLPEFPVSLEAVLSKLAGRRNGFLILTESAQITGLGAPEPEVHQSDLFGNMLYLNRNVGQHLALEIRFRFDYDARCEVLRDSIRGGPANSYDHWLAREFAVKAHAWILDRTGQPHPSALRNEGWPTFRRIMVDNARTVAERRLVHEAEVEADLAVVK